MNVRYISTLILTIIISVLTISCGNKKKAETSEHNTRINVAENQPKWTSIFNGSDLNGWTIKIPGYELGENFGNTLRVEDSILKIRYDAYGPEFKDRFGTVYFDKYLSNYRLKVVYRFVG